MLVCFACLAVAFVQSAIIYAVGHLTNAGTASLVTAGLFFATNGVVLWRVFRGDWR